VKLSILVLALRIANILSPTHYIENVQWGKKVGLYHLSLISRLNSITLINCCGLVKSCKHALLVTWELWQISVRNIIKREDISRKSTTQFQFYPGPVIIRATTATGLGLANLVWSKKITPTMSGSHVLCQPHSPQEVLIACLPLGIYFVNLMMVVK